MKKFDFQIVTISYLTASEGVICTECSASPSYTVDRCLFLDDATRLFRAGRFEDSLLTGFLFSLSRSCFNSEFRFSNLSTHKKNEKFVENEDVKASFKRVVRYNKLKK